MEKPNMILDYDGKQQLYEWKLDEHSSRVEPAFEFTKRYIDELEAKNAKLWELCELFAEYVSQDRCEGCLYKRRCNDGEMDECWQLAEIRDAARDLGIEVDE